MVTPNKIIDVLTVLYLSLLPDKNIRNMSCKLEGLFIIRKIGCSIKPVQRKLFGIRANIFRGLLVNELALFYILEKY